MLTDQLFKTSGLQFDNWPFGPKKFSGLLGPKSSQDFRETGPMPKLLEAWSALTKVNYHRNV